MKFTEEELAILESIPAGRKQELLQFAQFLTDKAKPEATTEKKTRRSGGWVKGKIWMSDDFNDPLEFVSPDEMRVLEAMRVGKRQELQEAAV